MSFETPIPPFNASDPYATFLNASCWDFLLIEMVPMARSLVGRLDFDEAESMDEDEVGEALCRRLESLGYRVGQGLVER